MQMISLSLLLIVTASGAGEKAPRIAEPKDYVVKRFQEIVSDSQGVDSALSPQEKVITYRARLAVAERRLTDLQTGVAETPETTSPFRGESSESKVRPQALRAVEARIDYYQKMIVAMETKILAEKKSGGRLDKKSDKKARKAAAKVVLPTPVAAPATAP